MPFSYILLLEYINNELGKNKNHNTTPMRIELNKCIRMGALLCTII